MLYCKMAEIQGTEVKTAENRTHLPRMALLFMIGHEKFRKKH
jgi:hypothetical protein